MSLLVGLAIVAGLGVFGYSRGLYYYVQFFWDDLFADVQTFGSDCEAGVGNWAADDSFQAVLQRPPTMKPMKMPYYKLPAAEKPDVGAQQFLYTRCRVDLSKLRADGFGWMRLHFVHGESAIFLNGKLKQTLGDTGVGEFPLTTEERLANSELVIISRPNALKAKLLGLPTSMPLIFTDSRADLAKPNIGALFDWNLRPAYWLNWSLIFLLIFAMAWVGGLKREDIGWLVVAMASNALMNALLFSSKNALDPSWRPVAQALAFSTNVALCCFVLAFTGSRLRWLKPWLVYFVAMATYVPLCFLPKGTISSAYLFFYIPTWLQIALYGSIGASSFMRQRDGTAFDYPRRMVFVTTFCVVLALARVVDLFLYRELYFSFSEILSEVGMTGFCIFLIFDLVISYRRYLAEKVQHMETQARAREFEAVARVTQMLAHDVRKPYQTLLNGLKLLDGPAAQGDVAAVSKRIRGEVERALGETNAMLSDVMDIGAVKSTVSGDFDLRKMAAECVIRAKELNQKSSIKVSEDWQGPTRLAVDPRRFQRVLMNLIENAVQAMPSEGVLKLSSLPAEIGGRAAVRLRIWNSGSFISDEDQAKIFDPFFTKNKSKGTGLGLAIVRKFVEAEGGSIACRSARGDGTEFILVLPAAAAAGAPGRLALIDDDVFVREVWQTVGSGWSVEVFDGPGAFWAAAGENRESFLGSFDLIMTDFYFGSEDEGTGEDFAKALKQIRADARVVLFSDVVLPEGERQIFDGQIAKGEEPTGELLGRFR